jgi:hypothetical protein
MGVESYSKIGSLEELEQDKGGDYLRWGAEIQAAEKELEKWQRKARKIIKQFRAEVSENMGIDINFERRYNIFAANTQILQSALLNQLPQPSVDREFNDEMDDVARVASRILERALTYRVRKNTKMYDLLNQVVQDNLVPGVGCSWHTYKAHIETRTEEPDEFALALDPNAKALEYEEIVGEEIIDDYVYWEDLLWSPARTWEEVRWVARKVYMTRDQLVERFGPEKGKQIGLDFTPKRGDYQVEVKNQVFQQAIIYEIWNKESKHVYWFSKSYEDGILDEKDDFLKLNGFFPCPKPLFATLSNGQLVPIPDYEYARDQYKELNEINTRISLLVRACRMAGVYDKSAGAVVQVLNNAAENVLVPVDQWAAFAEKGGMKGSIDWLPLDQIVATIEQLLKAREDVKNQIYEVTGMSDIIRGATKASETLGAQKIKAQYASMRIQTRQKNTAIYASQVFDIQAQLMRKHMSPEEIAKMAQVQFMGEDPQLVQAAMQLLKNPDDVELRVQVESTTLSDIDFQAERDSRMEYMTAITLFMKENGQALVNDPLIGPFLAQLLQFSLVGFRVGKKFEGKLDHTLQQIQKKLLAPQQPQPDPEQQKAQAEIQAMQQEAQLNAQGKQQELQFKAAEGKMKLQAVQSQVAAQQQKTQMDMRAAAMKHQQNMVQQAEAAQMRRQQQLMNAQIAGPGKPPQ